MVCNWINAVVYLKIILIRGGSVVGKPIITQRLNNGQFPFLCAVCFHSWKFTFLPTKRNVILHCLCGKVYRYVFERRQVARDERQESVRCFLKNGKIFFAQLCNVSQGGIACCDVPQRVSSQIEIGDEINTMFRYCGVDRTMAFFVRAIVGQQIGLQFCDGKNLSPQQRITMLANQK